MTIRRTVADKDARSWSGDAGAGESWRIVLFAPPNRRGNVFRTIPRGRALTCLDGEFGGMVAHCQPDRPGSS